MHDSSCNDSGSSIGPGSLTVAVRKHTTAPARSCPNAMPSYSDFGETHHRLTAGAFVQAFVPLVVFFSLQRYFVRGLLAGSVKG